MSLLTAAAILGAGAAVGFGAATAVQVVQGRTRSPAALPPVSVATCVDEIWSPAIRIDHDASLALSHPALLTSAQFPGFQLSPEAQAEALDTLAEYFGEVEEEAVEEGVMLDFPGVEGSSIPDDGMVVGVTRSLERVLNYRRFGAAAVASVLAPECPWPEPFSTEIPDDPKAADVWMALEELAVVALADRDEAQIRVDVDPAGTVLDDLLEACVGGELVLPIRSPTTLSPKIGATDDESWQMTHAAQEQAFALLSAHLANPDTTAPVSATVAEMAPRCPWGNKSEYGLRMTSLWHDVRRLEQIADQPAEETP